jgi:uncharacterized membrane protein YagU involved in acid resistance
MYINLIKVVAAGIISGIVATKVKTIFEDNYPVRSSSTDSPPVVLANRLEKKINKRELSNTEKQKAETAIHWAFGVSISVLYCLLAERNKNAANGLGTKMGLALYALTHYSTLPVLKTEPWPHNNKPKYARNEFIGHIVYGCSAELVRRISLKRSLKKFK